MLDLLVEVALGTFDILWELFYVDEQDRKSRASQSKRQIGLV
jgi:hypothetical protein